MKIKWQEKARCWYGVPKSSFPRFEAWRSDEAGNDPWCLNMVKSPNARPIKVRHLQSLDDAKEFAQGLLAEFSFTPDTDVTVGEHRKAEKARIAQTFGIEPLPQTT